jgi:glycogen phosphorylase
VTEPPQGPLALRLPPAIAGLLDIALNLRWAWDERSAELFRRLDRDAWEKTEHNPVLVLATGSEERFAQLAGDPGFVAEVEAVAEDLRRYTVEPRWYQSRPDLPSSIAYFSPEFAVTETLPIYSGGLGVLAGDHLKTASDLGVPMLAVGLLYWQGYFRQSLDPGGWQQEQYPTNDPLRLPLTPALRPGGDPLLVTMDLAGRPTALRLWKAQVGRVPLWLLDSAVESNGPEERAITDRLYRSEMEHRLRQEIVLGVGGCIALDALGARPEVYHLNEGHAGFLALERIRRLVVEEGLSFAEAIDAARPGLIFTTHTPVPAGIDMFSRELMERYFASFAEQCGIPFDQLVAIGQANPSDYWSPFNMAVMALRLSGAANGVSRLHGAVSRRMFHHLWPGTPVDEVPITSVTNGVHPATWVGPDTRSFLDRHLGTGWNEGALGHDAWERLRDVPDEELWSLREKARPRLVKLVRARVRRQLLARGIEDVAWVDELFEPYALTIGFARRFAEYKRATLLLTDLDRLHHILESGPAQIVFAGKAHPRDDGGKELIRRVVNLSADPRLRTRLAFVEDYDLALARQLFQGVDGWLNTPRRPLEACGTSGMKAALNGALNVSILDGWWDELYDGTNGWAIGGREDISDPWTQDEADARDLYEVLEGEVLPAFYDRDDVGIPRRWIERMKSSLATLGPEVGSGRMLRDYVDQLYAPAGRSRGGVLPVEP